MSELDKLISKIIEAIVNPIILLLFGLAVLYFLWGVFQYISKANSEDARKEGAQHMFWGVIGIAIMVSAFAIVNLIAGTFDIPKGGLPDFIK